MNLTELPEGILEVVARHLAAKDLLNFLSAHQTFRCLGSVPKFWIALSDLQYPTFSTSTSLANTSSGASGDRDETGCPLVVKKAKDAYLMRAHCHLLPQVRWYAIAEGVRTPAAREGHLACRLGNFIVLTGGFTQDPAIYVKDIRNNNEDWLRILPDADSPRPEWVYGASLTALDETRAIRFGGFRMGGYSDETYQVAILHLTVAAITVNTTFASSSDAPQFRARWEIVRCHYGTTPIVNVERDWFHQAARAYHAAILLQQRYLLVVGGMQSQQSILHPLILDTQTWTWHTESVTTDAGPSPRHGCSLVHDAARDQLVLFGGGSGNDLLRSGRDFPEVWELVMNNSTCRPVSNDSQTSQRDILSTLPWTWRLRHNLNDHGGEANDPGPNALSAAEKLNLGRCHGCYHVSYDTCLLAFGSGRPSNNSILGYQLKTKEFFRPAVRGPLPQDRFTFASVHLLELGYIVFHGGYSSRFSDTMSGTCVLDLAPGLQRPFQMWSVDQNARSHHVLTAEELAFQELLHNQNRFERFIGHTTRPHAYSMGGDGQLYYNDNEGEHSTDDDYSDDEEDSLE